GFHLSAVLEVGSDAEDLEIGIMRSLGHLVEEVELDLLADRIILSEESANKGLIDDGYTTSGFDVELGKRSASHQAKAKRLKVGFAAQVHHGRPVLRGWFSQNCDFAARSA